MSKRDELAKAIFIADNARQSREQCEEDWAAMIEAGGHNYAHGIADGLLEAGWTTRSAVIEELIAKLAATQPGPNWLGYKAWTNDWLRAELEGGHRG